jgi:hypothetical protein
MANFDVSYLIKAVDDFSPVLDKFRKELNNSEKKVGSLNDRLKTLRSTATSWHSGLLHAARTMAVPFGLINTYIFKVAKDFEQYRLKLFATIGDWGKTDEVFSRLKDITAETGLNIAKVTQSVATMVQIGVPTDEAMNRLRQLKILSFATGKDINSLTDRMKRVFVGQSLPLRMITSIPIIIGQLKKLAIAEGKWSKERWENWVATASRAGTKIPAWLVLRAMDQLTQKGASATLSYEENLKSLHVSFERMHEITKLLADDFFNLFFGGDVKDEIYGWTNSFGEFQKKLHEMIKFSPEFKKNMRGLASDLLGVAKVLGVGFGIAIAFTGTLAAISSPFFALGLAASFAYLAISAVWEVIKEISEKGLGGYFTNLGKELKEFGALTSKVLFTGETQGMQTTMNAAQLKVNKAFGLTASLPDASKYDYTKTPEELPLSERQIRNLQAVFPQSSSQQSNVKVDINVNDRNKNIKSVNTEYAGPASFKTGLSSLSAQSSW